MSEILIYQDENQQSQIEVRLENDTVWLNQKQMAELFDRDYKTISKHVRNVIAEGELDASSTVAKIATVQNEGSRTISRDLEYYNLDMIISVGYRVNSRRGTLFRQWATQRLREYITQGYAIDRKRLELFREKSEQLQNALELIRKSRESKDLTSKELNGVLDILSKYGQALVNLQNYDSKELEISDVEKNITFTIEYDQAREVIAELRKSLNASNLFGNEKDESFEGILINVVQTWDGQYLYPSIEEQAAHLLYFIIKNHPFSDGNKRIGAFLFIWFLDRNKHRFDDKGNVKINANGLTALALLVAQSNPDDKDMMIKLVVNLIR
jgi:prophage maintenance system killer protein